MELLIVDDQKDIREGIGQTIDWAQHGLHVCGTAENGNAAVSLIERHDPEILIVDIRMPGMDGLELLEIINDRYPLTKVILISGYNDFQYAQRALELRAYAYLLKPLDVDELISKVLDAKREIENQRSRIRENRELSLRLAEGIPVLRDNFISRLVSDPSLKHETDLLDRAALLGLPTTPGSFRIVLFELARTGFHTSHGIYDWKLARVALQNKLPEFFPEELTIIPFVHQDWSGALLYGPEKEPSQILESCRSIREWARRELGTALSVGIGPAVTSLFDLGETFQNARVALDYRMVVGRNEIVEFSSIQTSYRSSAALESYRRRLAATTTKVLWAMQTGDDPEVENTLDDIVRDYLDAVKQEPAITEATAYLLAFQLAQLRIPLRMEFKPMAVAELYSTLRGHQTPDSLRQSISAYLVDLRESGNAGNGSQNSFIVDKAVDFIHRHLHDNVSLSAVARSLLIHPNYLSKLFRESQRESFIEYVTRVKMQEAQRLLKETTDRIYEVADRVGYRDVDHFTRLFKKLVGVSPSQYREFG